VSDRAGCYPKRIEVVYDDGERWALDVKTPSLEEAGWVKDCLERLERTARSTWRQISDASPGQLIEVDGKHYDRDGRLKTDE
jgi:hypothetical protein